MNRNIFLFPLEIIFCCVIQAFFTSPLPADENGANPDTVLAFQLENGGWPKNYDRRETLTASRLEQVRSQKGRVDQATIDNGATHQEIRILAEFYRKTRDPKYAAAALRGIDYLLAAQYANGGWPQYYPARDGYARHITFNDGAMIGVMTLLRDIASDEPTFGFVSVDMRGRCKTAIERGVVCILACQVEVDGNLTVWCAQHDCETLEPRQARSYELASLSGGESAGIVRYLMQIDRPAPQIVAAVESAIAWYERSKLLGQRVESYTNTEGQRDRRVVPDADAPPLWARFYDIATNRPIFCSRDGIPRATLAEISHERRNGYSWLGDYGRRLLDEDYPTWKKSLARATRSCAGDNRAPTPADAVDGRRESP